MSTSAQNSVRQKRLQTPLASRFSRYLAVHALAMRLKVRSAGGDGRRALFASVSPSDTVETLKKIVCSCPHSLCSDACSLVLVLKGTPRIALAPHAASNACSLAGCILSNCSTLSNAGIAQASVLTAICLQTSLRGANSGRSACVAAPAPIACEALPPPSLSALSSPTASALIGEGSRVRIVCLQVRERPPDVCCS